MAKPSASKPLTPAAAIDRLEELYAKAASGLVSALDRYLETRTPPSASMRAQFHYPLLRVIYRNDIHTRSATRRAFAKLERPGVYETTVTHPGPFRSYLLEQLDPLVSEYGAEIEVEGSSQEIPYPYVIERAEEIARAHRWP
jgi:AMP nucleosidase